MSKTDCDIPKISLEYLQGIKGFWVPPAIQSGANNMAVDKAILEGLIQQTEPILILRAYAWAEPTLSLGINQPHRDLEALAPPLSMPVVRRSTGGRAIWHGEDYSYAVVSNSKTLLNLSVRDSYCIIRQLLEKCLQKLGLATEQENLSNAKKNATQELQGATRTYTRSPECFATHMPDDLLLKSSEQPTIQKIAGSAQCRKAGGMLQHGSLYLKSEGISFGAFTEALKQSAEECLGSPLHHWPIPELVERP